MGKSKKRIFNKNNVMKGTTLKRSEIIAQILFDVKNNVLSEETKKMISLFGITPEELTEAGAEIEDLSIVKSVLF